MSLMRVGSLLKLWMRELEKPIVPSSLYDDAVAAAKADDVAASIAVAEKLPSLNKRVAFYMVGYLRDMAVPENVPLTKMSVINLAMVFAPNFLRCPSEDPSVIFSTQKHQQTFVKHLIEEWKATELNNDKKYAIASKKAKSPREKASASAKTSRKDSRKLTKNGSATEGKETEVKKEPENEEMGESEEVKLGHGESAVNKSRSKSSGRSLSKSSSRSNGRSLSKSSSNKSTMSDSEGAQAAEVEPVMKRSESVMNKFIQEQLEALHPNSAEVKDSTEETSENSLQSVKSNGKMSRGPLESSSGHDEEASSVSHESGSVVEESSAASLSAE